jgi:NAD(P)-dependent dehydrogenase (short-subunit alcohol dehydrogenase family)
MNFPKNSIALITGSGRGLGQAMAIQLAQEGLEVGINDISEDAIQNTIEDIQNSGGKAFSAQGNIAEPDSVKELMAKISKEKGELHYLVNNAGILRDGMLHKLSEKDFNDVIDVNLKGVFYSTQAFIQSFGKKEDPKARSIVNIASIAYLGNMGQSNYSAAKAGVVAMTKTWSQELSKLCIRVNAVAPGLMDTEMIRSIPEEIQKQMIARIPLKRVGRPEELARAVSFLLSEDASYITGHTIHLDGGMTAGF